MPNLPCGVHTSIIDYFGLELGINKSLTTRPVLNFGQANCAVLHQLNGQIFLTINSRCQTVLGRVQFRCLSAAEPLDAQKRPAMLSCPQKEARSILAFGRGE